jgi:hypothetical protein
MMRESLRSTHHVSSIHDQVETIFVLFDQISLSLVSSSSLQDNRTMWPSTGLKSSLTILGQSLESNRTYQWMVMMTNRRNSTLQATGYLLVSVDDAHPQMVVIGSVPTYCCALKRSSLSVFSCVITRMCVPNQEFQLVNPTTQVSLFSRCFERCPSLMNITWSIYQGFNRSLTTIQWQLFNQMSQLENRWFFGRLFNSSSLQ